MTKEIVLLSGSDVLCTEPVKASFRRFSMQAAAEQKQIDEMKNRHPSATAAKIVSPTGREIDFRFDSNGRSVIVLYQQGIMTMQFKFSTDSEVGTIEAEDFDAACNKLQAMITPEAQSDGAWGWVEDHDGDRFWIGGNN